MEIGTGIFFSGLFLGLIYLFVQTRTVWRWRKIILWSFGIPICLCVLGFLSLYAYSSWNNRLKVITSFHGVSLNENLSDVFFKDSSFLKVMSMPDDSLVSFPRSMADNEINNLILEKFPDFENKIDKIFEYFGSDNTNIIIYPVNKKVSRIAYHCKKGHDFKSVNGIGCNDKGDKIINKYGNSLQILCLKKEYGEHMSARLYQAPKYGVRYVMYKNSVTSFLIANSNFFQSSEHWETCE